MRESNIELCRIVTMLLVLIVHSDFATLGNPTNWETPHLGLLFSQSLSVVGVNVFVLISGYFSIRPKKQSVFRLLYCCFFYAVLFAFFSYYNNSFSLYQLLFVSEANWFVSAYLGLMLLSPVLNVYVENISKKTFAWTILVLLVFQTWYEVVPKFIPDFHGGYSILSFCILYLIARYLFLYPPIITSMGKCLFAYFIITIFLTFSIYITLIIDYKPETIIREMLKYNNPIVILSSVCLFLTFAKMNIGKSRIINHLAKSCIAVLLIHTSQVFFPYYNKLFKIIFYNTSGVLTLSCWMFAIILTYLLCSIVDQIRLLTESKFIKLFWK